MLQPEPSVRSRKKALILGSIAGFLILTVAISVIVGFSVRFVTDNANSLDNDRSRSTIGAALHDVTARMEGITRDNTFWDVAAAEVYKNNVEWMVDSWGLTTADYPLYDEALVVESDGTPIIAYADGAPMTASPAQHYGPAFTALLQKVKLSEASGKDALMVSSFAITPKGLTVVGIGAVLSTDVNLKIAHDKRRYLVLARSQTGSHITAIGTEHVVPGLRFELTETPGLISHPVTDSAGTTLGYLTWPAQNPGHMSFNRVAPYLSAALALLGLLIIGFFVFSRFLVRDINRDRLMAQHKSTHDPLSGLLNRSGIFSILDEMISTRTSNKVPALLYLDLDGFKEVNDSYGHAVGDNLIRNVSSGLLDLAPQTAHVSRLGGDEFAILLSADHARDEAGRIAAAIHRMLKEPFNIDGRVIVVGASIGIALADSPGITGAELIRQADLAMYRAKDSGRGRTSFYQTGFDDERTRLHQLEADLRQAIVADELTVAYQPLVDAKPACGTASKPSRAGITSGLAKSSARIFSSPWPSEPD